MRAGRLSEKSPLAAGAVVALLLLVRVAWATDDTRKQEAARLAKESMAHYHRGDALEHGWEQEYGEGISLAEKAIALDPDDADAYYALFVNLGQKAQRNGVVAQARTVSRLKELLKKTLELDPRHADAWEATGEMLIRLPWILGGSDQRGEEALERAAEIDPKWAKPPLRLGQLHWRKGEVERARREAERAAALAEKAADADYLEEARQLLEEIGRRSEPLR